MEAIIGDDKFHLVDIEDLGEDPDITLMIMAHRSLVGFLRRSVLKCVCLVLVCIVQMLRFVNKASNECNKRLQMFHIYYINFQVELSYGGLKQDRILTETLPWQYLNEIGPNAKEKFGYV